MKKIMLLACIASVAVPAVADAQRSQRSARRENRAQSQDIDDRMGRTIAAVTTAEGRGAIDAGRADEIRNMIDRMRSDYSRNKQKQGFVSAGELASYNRSLDQVDREISGR